MTCMKQVVFGSYTSSMKNDQLETKSLKKIDVTIFQNTFLKSKFSSENIPLSQTLPQKDSEA